MGNTTLLKILKHKHAKKSRVTPTSNEENTSLLAESAESQVRPTLGYQESWDTLMEAGYSIDGHAYTPARIISVFFPKPFKTLFLENHASHGVIGLAAFLAILSFCLRIPEIKDQLLEEESSDHDVLSTLMAYSDQDIDTIREKLNVIAGELFKMTLIILKESDGRYRLNFTTEEKKEDNKTITSFLDWTRKSNLSTLVKLVWMILGVYSMFYWIVFMTAMLIPGAVLTPVLAFGLPAIIPMAAFLCIKLIVKAIGLLNKNNHTPLQESEDNKLRKLLIFRALADELLMDKLRASIIDQNIESNNEEPLQEHDNHSLEEKKNLPDFFKKLFKSKVFVISLSFISALVSGYVVASFAQWPITDLLIQVFHVSSVGSILGLSHTAVYIVFGIALSIGVFLAIKASVEKYQAIERNKPDDHTDASYCKKLRDKKRRILKKKRTKENELKMLPDWKEDHGNLIKKILRYIGVWINGAGTGVFVIRTIMLAGCIAPLLLGGPIPWAISFIAAMSIGFVWGTIKVIERYLGDEEARDKEMPQVVWSYKKELKLLHEVAESSLISKTVKNNQNSEDITPHISSKQTYWK